MGLLDPPALSKTQVDARVAAAVAGSPSVATAAQQAVTAALVNEQVAHGETIAQDAIGFRFTDGPYFLYMEEAHDYTGWASYIRYQTGEVAWGIRLDGSIYPAPAATSTPATSTAALVISGDSLAQNWGTRVSALTSTLGRAVHNQGVGGQSTDGIAARQGGGPSLLTVDSNTIPASGSVAVTNLSVSLLARPTDGTQTAVGSLAGVAGTLTNVQTGSSQVYTFTRTTSGTAMPCPPGTPFVTGLDFRADVPIFVAGRNAIGEGTFRRPLATILDDFRTMLGYSTARDRALILSVLPRADEDTIGTAARTILDQLNDALRTTFPTHYLDWGAYLRSDTAFAVAGVAKTAQDVTDIANGLTPTTFRTNSTGDVDIVHIQDSGYAAANALIIQTLQARGW